MSKHNRNFPRIQTAGGERGNVLKIDGNWAYVAFGNGAVQKHHVSALTPKDRSIKRNAIITRAKDEVAKREVEDFLRKNPSAWQSVPQTYYSDSE
jgi:hypothetical protein